MQLVSCICPWISHLIYLCLHKLQKGQTPRAFEMIILLGVLNSLTHSVTLLWWLNFLDLCFQYLWNGVNRGKKTIWLLWVINEKINKMFVIQQCQCTVFRKYHTSFKYFCLMGKCLFCVYIWDIWKSPVFSGTFILWLLRYIWVPERFSRFSICNSKLQANAQGQLLGFFSGCFDGQIHGFVCFSFSNSSHTS